MEAVYGLLGVDRGVPEVWGSVYDIRTLLESTVCLMDGRSPLDALPGPVQMAAKPLLRLVQGTVAEQLLRRYKHPAARYDGISHAKSPPAAVRPRGCPVPGPVLTGTRSPYNRT